MINLVIMNAMVVAYDARCVIILLSLVGSSFNISSIFYNTFAV